MITYAYRCPACGSVDIAFPMGGAPAQAACPLCGTRTRRRWTAPALARLPRGIREAHAREERSRDEPEVVSTPGPGRRL